MDHVDLFEFGIGEETFNILPIVIDITGNVSLDWASCDFLNELFAEALEEDVK